MEDDNHPAMDRRASCSETSTISRELLSSSGRMPSATRPPSGVRTTDLPEDRRICLTTSLLDFIQDALGDLALADFTPLPVLVPEQFVQMFQGQANRSKPDLRLF